MSRRVIVPVNLPCCAEPPFCHLCAPTASAVTAELVDALIFHYRNDVARDGDQLLVSFFGGAPPSEALLEATGDLPVRARVRPDLLTRAEAARLVSAGTVAIELDALSMHDPSLRAIGRQHRSGIIPEMSAGLREQGVEVGIVLAVGLPRSDHDSCIEDARRILPLADFARLHPVLVLRGSRLEQQHLDQLYHPLSVQAAVHTCRHMLDILEGGGVEVIRIGLQAGPDGLGRAVAGPTHSALRQLVEAKRVLDVLRGLMTGQSSGPHIAVRCAPADETRTRGPFNEHVRILKAEYKLSTVRVVPDPEMSRGQWRVEASRESA